MIKIRVQKGYNIKINGRPSPDLEILEKPAEVALMPERIPFVKPRLKVKVDDPVNVGSIIFEDKRNPDLVFLSPGGGRVMKINYGPRRIIREIVISLDQNEAYEAFPIINEVRLKESRRNELVKMILSGGLWSLFRAFPFRDIPNPDSIPPLIIVSLNTLEPFQPLPETYLKDNFNLFEFGIKILKKLTNRLIVSTSSDNAFILDRLDGQVTHICNSVYPADDPGVLLYHIKKKSDENKTWYIGGQDVLLLAMLLKTGKYPITKTIVMGGSLAKERKHFLTRTGVSLGHIAKGRTDTQKTARYVVGGIFRGYTGREDSYMGFYESSLLALPEGKEKEFFGFARLGYGKPSRSRTFLSFINPSTLSVDCNCHGEKRACINCGFCADICPVDILPQFTYKNILADEIDEALEHGLLDCVECGLCTYACPSKLELCSIFKNTKKAYYLGKL